MLSLLSRTLFFSAVAYILICLCLFFFQSRLIFFPKKIADDYVFSFSNTGEVFLESDKTTIHGLYFKKENPKGVILYFHGNAGAVDNWGHIEKDFQEYNYDMLIMDYRSFGKSKGILSEDNLYQDAQTAYNYLTKTFNKENIVIYGRSIGAGVASHLAAHNKAKMLLLETPFYSLMDIAKNHFKIFPKKLLLKYVFPNHHYIPKIDYPVYIFHGTDDTIINYSSGKKLANLIRKGSLITIEKGGHNNLNKFPKYHQELSSILSE